MIILEILLGSKMIVTYENRYEIEELYQRAKNFMESKTAKMLEALLYCKNFGTITSYFHDDPKEKLGLIGDNMRRL